MNFKIYFEYYLCFRDKVYTRNPIYDKLRFFKEFDGGRYTFNYMRYVLKSIIFYRDFI